MSGRIQDDTSNNQANPPSAKLSEDNLSASDGDLISSIQEPDMEVHHHTHPTHGKKTFKNFVWEFLMLFLAVFCGFLAEWELEHIIEHSREKEFMESMVIDLKSDSSKLVNMKSQFGVVSTQIDSLIPLLNDHSQLVQHATDIYQHQVYLNFYVKWIYSDRTIDQLKNSGNFRLIRKRAVSNDIIKYDGFIRNFIDDMQKSLIQKQWQSIIDAGNDIFKSSVFRAYFNSGNFRRHSVIMPNTPYFLTNDQIVIQKFINMLDQYAVSLDWFRINIDIALQQNRTLDSLITTEYHLN